MADFIHFSELLPKAIQRYKMGRETRAALVCERFRGCAKELLGESAGQKIQPRHYKHHVLTIAVPDSIWAQKLYNLRHDFLELLNKKGDIEVKDLKMRVEG